MLKASLVTGLVLGLSTAMAADDCKQDQAKEAVLKMCAEIEKDADKGLEVVHSFRFCGTNYVWVQDTSAEIVMVNHPIKPKLNGQPIGKNADDNGKLLFSEFDKAAKANKDGAWVDYVWPKPGAEKATPKISFVKMCGGTKKWIAGSGVWK
jgi:signal transduction histidine kinase